MPERPRCSFCGTSDAAAPSGGASACEPCGRRVAQVAVSGVGGADEVWARDLADPCETVAAYEEEANAVVRRDAESHLRLAEAYREMGFFAAARRSLSVVLRAEKR